VTENGWPALCEIDLLVQFPCFVGCKMGRKCSFEVYNLQLKWFYLLYTLYEQNPKRKDTRALLRELSLSCEEGAERRAQPNHILAGETIQRPTLPRLCPPPLGPCLAQRPVRRLAQHRNHQAGACCLILVLSPRALLEFSEFVSVWPCPWSWVAS
jgi:hypothetical protein